MYIYVIYVYINIEESFFKSFYIIYRTNYIIDLLTKYTNHFLSRISNLF